LAIFAKIWPLLPKFGRSLQVTTFWLQWVAQTYFLWQFYMYMCSLAWSPLNKNNFIKIGQKGVCHWRHKFFIEIKRKKYFLCIFMKTFAQIIMKMYCFVNEYDLEDMWRVLLKNIEKLRFFFCLSLYFWPGYE
jgi:hypothetical protein